MLNRSGQGIERDEAVKLKRSAVVVVQNRIDFLLILVEFVAHVTGERVGKIIVSEFETTQLQTGHLPGVEPAHRHFPIRHTNLHHVVSRHWLMLKPIGPRLRG